MSDVLSEGTPAATGSAHRRPRSDSLRNRARILEAAEEIFGSEGIAVPVDRIAERAGVGVGTLYRHFPNKEDLFEAIVLQHFRRILEEARSIEASAEPGQALYSLLSNVVAVANEKRDLAEALAGAGIDFKASAGELKNALDACLQQLLARAQAVGDIRDDVTFGDLMGLVSGACLQADRSGPTPACPFKMFDVVWAGMQAPPSRQRP
jgi:AcrR family transcriptional regulator